MKIAECKVREKLATFNQLKIFLYALAAEYARLFEEIFPFLGPRMWPYRVELNLSGASPKHVLPASSWQMNFASQTKYARTGANHKKWQFFLDYRRESPEDFTCCGQGLRRLVVFGAMKFFHVEAKPLSEFYLVQASGNWPHESVGLGLYFANEYPEAEVGSIEQMKNIIIGDQQNASAESAAMMD